MSDLAHFVDGLALTTGSARWGDIFDPNTGETQRRVPLGDAALVDQAVRAALAAQPAWTALNPQRRARVLFEFKRLVEARMDELRACYRRALATRPTLQGEASLMLDTGDDGAVSSVLVGGGTPASTDPTLRACLTRFGRSFTFPAVKNTNFIYVLSFGA